MTSNARRKQRARARKSALDLPYTAARHTVAGGRQELSLCPGWCIAHRYHAGDALDPTDAGFAVHDGMRVAVGPSQAGGNTAIQLCATICGRPSDSVIDVVVRADVGGDLWWPLPQAAVLHASLGELLVAAERPLDAEGCRSGCVRHVDIEPDNMDPASLASVVHRGAAIPVPSIHLGEITVHIESDVDTDGRRTDEIVVGSGGIATVVWSLDAARIAHSVIATALRTAATDPRLPPAALPR